MKRKPTDPIPGFEDEFTGTVGKEKRIHKTHFEVPSIKLSKSNFNSQYEWVEERPGRWRLVKRSVESEEGAVSAARAGGT